MQGYELVVFKTWRWRSGHCNRHRATIAVQTLPMLGCPARTFRLFHAYTSSLDAQLGKNPCFQRSRSSSENVTILVRNCCLADARNVRRSRSELVEPRGLQRMQATEVHPDVFLLPVEKSHAFRFFFVDPRRGRRGRLTTTNHRHVSSERIRARFIINQ